VWRGLEADSAGQRFAHDLALIVTKEPIDVGLPPSFDKLADDETMGPEILSVRPSDAAVTPRYEALRGELETGLSHRGVLVAFGADKCSSLRQCGDAGIRRYPADLDQGERRLLQRFSRPAALAAFAA
jgi:hypothetical protein